MAMIRMIQTMVVVVVPAVAVAGDITMMTEDLLVIFRNHYIGFVFLYMMARLILCHVLTSVGNSFEGKKFPRKKRFGTPLSI